MNNKIKDKRAIKILIGNIFVRAGRIVFQIFLNIFIWKNTGDIKQVALFNMIYLTSHFFSFVVFSVFVKKGFRRFFNIFSLVGFAFVYLFIVILGEKSINHLVLIPLLIGLFNGMYWINFHNNQFDLTTFHNRGNFEGIKKSMMIATKIIIPSFIGFIITLNYMGCGYEISFSFGIIFLLLSALIGTVKIDVKNNEKYDLLLVFKKIIKKKDVFRSLYTYSFSGFSFSNSLLDVLIPIILFTYVKEEANVGFLISGFSIITIISSYLFGKFVSYKRYNLTIVIVGISYVLSILGFITFSEIKYIILFSAILNMFATLFSIPQKVFNDNVLHKIKNYKKIRSEYMVIREIFLYTGWMSSFVIIYFIGSIEVEYLYYLFVAIMVAVGIATYLLSGVNMYKKLDE